MVREYLEKIKDEFVRARVDVLEEINSCNYRLKENIQFIHILEDTRDQNYEAFTPREVNVFNRKKIEELKEGQKEISEQLNCLKDKQRELDCKIDEINNVLTALKNSSQIVSENNINADMKMTLLQTVERERQRIARDLHDTTAQGLTSLVHKSELCAKLIEADPVRCKLELLSFGKILRNMIDETRRLIFDLRPMSFDDFEFDESVEKSLDKFRVSSGMQCNYQIVGEPYEVASIVQLTLLRVIQEACNNVVKHANATRLDIRLEYGVNRLSLEIKDDGTGFDIDSIPINSRQDHSGFGILMMRERIYLLSGKFEIRSNPGEGCSILVTVPV